MLDWVKKKINEENNGLFSNNTFNKLDNIEQQIDDVKLFKQSEKNLKVEENNIEKKEIQKNLIEQYNSNIISNSKLVIEDVFSLKDGVNGIIIVGKVSEGEFFVEDEVNIITEDNSFKAKINGMECFGEEINCATKGTSIGVYLAGKKINNTLVKSGNLLIK